MILQRIYPAEGNTGKQEGIAMFYAGGILNCCFRLTREDTSADATLFLGVVEEIAKQMLDEKGYRPACESKRGDVLK